MAWWTGFGWVVEGHVMYSWPWYIMKARRYPKNMDRARALDVGA